MCLFWLRPEDCRTVVKAKSKATNRTPKEDKNKSKSIARHKVVAKATVAPQTRTGAEGNARTTGPQNRIVRMERSTHQEASSNDQFVKECACHYCRLISQRYRINAGELYAHGFGNQVTINGGGSDDVDYSKTIKASTGKWWDTLNNDGSRKNSVTGWEYVGNNRHKKNQALASQNGYGNLPKVDAAGPGGPHVPHAPNFFSIKSPVRHTPPAASIETTSAADINDNKSPQSPRPVSEPYPQVYVCPRSMAHLSFPVVDYSANKWEPVATWPCFYTAIVPNCATLDDLRSTLAPEGSGLHLNARSSDNGSTVEVTSFYNITELRCNTLQLEIWTNEQLETERAEEMPKKVNSVPYGSSSGWGTGTPDKNKTKQNAGKRRGKDGR